MKRFAIAFMLVLPSSGCAHGLDKSLDVVEKGAAGIRVVTDESSKVWAAGVEAQVGFCKAKGLGPDASDAERAKCMGLLGKGEQAEPALRLLIMGYDELAKALETLRQAEKEVAPFLEAAEEAIRAKGRKK